ncbi:MAG TPA: phosphoribosyltransferase family protein [Actinomycetota bacterium]|nr:phosphoribosyltransferase family protein [Actinomycetota bacterium]
MPEAPFRDRTDAGRQLAGAVAALHLTDPIVLGLPRGGVVVAAPVARALGAQLGVLVVRKLGAPRQPELGFGALAEGPTRVLNHALVAELGLTPDEVDAITAREQAELDRRVRRYRGDRPAPGVAGCTVVLVDDGIATGATVRAAIDVLRAQGAGRVVVAAPVAPTEVVAGLAGLADAIVVLHRPARFLAIGFWYHDFEQVPDDEVVGLVQAGPSAKEGR